MNTSTLKKFSTKARTDLMEQVGKRLKYVLTADSVPLREQEAVVRQLQRSVKRVGEAALIEQVAYTWFNRLAALRYLDARGWHPFGCRVLTPASDSETQPELLKLTRSGALPELLKTHTNPVRLDDLLDGRVPSPDPQAEVYRHLILAACRFYHSLLPSLFEKLDDETELLLPDDLLTQASVAEAFRANISDADCSEVEILGWLYQFYIAEKKDVVMARKKVVPSADIPAVTQLFTPHWIVRYLVENSLGRLWLNSRPNSGLKEHMPYYVEDPEPDTTEEAPQHFVYGLDSADFDNLDPEALLWLRPNIQYQKDSAAIRHYAHTIKGYECTIPGKREKGMEALRDLRDGFRGENWKGATFEELRLCLFYNEREIRGTTSWDHVDFSKWDEREEQQEQFKIYQLLCEKWVQEWENHKESAQKASRIFQRSINDGESTLNPKPNFKSSGIRESCLRVDSPEEIKLLDPACGSGHMLTYAFDLLVKIYEEEGHAPSEIPEKILTHNLFGLEICPRAAQLAQFALLCKAREQSRTAFRRPVQPHVMCLQNVVITPEEMQQWGEATGVKLSSDELSQIHQFRQNTETFGSLIQPVLGVEELAQLRGKIGSQVQDGDLLVQNTHRKLHLVIDQAEMLSQRYHVAVANPPYMGFKQMNSALRTLGERSFNEGGKDLYAMFIQRNLRSGIPKGNIAMITMDSWMSGDDHTELREWIYRSAWCRNMLHLGPRAFDEISGEVVQVTAFVFTNDNCPNRDGIYFRLTTQKPSAAKEQAFLRQENQFLAAFARFSDVPRKILAYHASKSTLSAFEDGQPLRKFAEAFTGLQTGDNQRFIHYWYEVSNVEIAFLCTDRDAAKRTGRRWFPYVKGSDFRKWFGNNICVLDWLSDGEEIRSHPGARPQNSSYYFRAGLAYNNIANKFSVRHVDSGHIFDQKNSMFFSSSSKLQDLALSFLNSSVVAPFLEILSPKDFNPGSLRVIPVLSDNLPKSGIESVVEGLVHLARADWDNFETSWDFCDLPLLRPGDWEVEPGHPYRPWKGRTLAESWHNYAAYCVAAIRRMQELETENNRLWIDAYGLQDELTPEVPEEEITLARADARKDMAAFLSYAVGCMMGRFSLDKPGLILADAGDTVENYLAKVGKPLDQLQFKPDNDAIIPVLEGEWFEDDIVARSREFLRATFGPETLQENIRFLEESLGKDLRKYFFNDFYKDHLQTYKKRPIYWLVQSPNKSFQALIYLHRYNRDTFNLILNDYLREFQNKLRNRLEHLKEVLASESTSARDKNAATKEQAKIEKALPELADWERDVILPLAQQRLEIDLDDGVKQNYPKFGKALAKIPGVS